MSHQRTATGLVEEVWVGVLVVRSNPERCRDRRAAPPAGQPLWWAAYSAGRNLVTAWECGGVELADEAIRLGDLPPAPRRTIAVLGHEATGIPPEALDVLDVVVEIPVVGTGLSLNVAVAGSLALYKRDAPDGWRAVAARKTARRDPSAPPPVSANMKAVPASML